MMQPKNKNVRSYTIPNILHNIYGGTRPTFDNETVVEVNDQVIKRLNDIYKKLWEEFKT